MQVVNLKTRKPLRTAAELEVLIKRELAGVYKPFPDIAVAVVPDGSSWKVALPTNFVRDSGTAIRK